MPIDPLPKYGACEYSMFISYAHRDNTANNQWISALDDALRDRLNNLPKDVTRLKTHLSEKDGSAGGDLLDELSERIPLSFGMLLVIGDRYQESDWCEKELQIFHEKFGRVGCKKRLLIAAMSEDAITRALARPTWKEALGENPVWVRMFQERDPNLPLTPKRSDGTFEDEFWRQTVKLTDRLILQITEDYEEAKGSAADRGVGPEVIVNNPWSKSNARSEPLRVALAPCTALLVGKTEMLKNILESKGAIVHVLDPDVINKYVPETGKPLRQILGAHDVLVAPVCDETPLCAMVAGGHTSILQDEWKERRPGIVWYRPNDVVVPADMVAAEKHTALFSKLGPVCASEQAVVNLLFGVDPANVVRVYVEKHHLAPWHFRIARQLTGTWAQLARTAGRPPLRCDLLELSDLESAKNKVPAAVVLLFPQGVKDSDSLLAQLDGVMKAFPKTGAVYPGCIAVICTPPPTDTHLHEWTDLTFCKYDTEPMLRMDPNSENELSEFLNEVWNQVQSDSDYGRMSQN